MYIKRSATSLAMLFLIAWSSACSPAATPTYEYEPTYEYDEPAAEATEAPYQPDLFAPAPTQEARSESAWPAMPTVTASGMQPPNGQSAADMFFQNYGVNPSIDTEDDNLSTFALDVDTGSYTV